MKKRREGKKRVGGKKQIPPSINQKGKGRKAPKSLISKQKEGKKEEKRKKGRNALLYTRCEERSREEDSPRWERTRTVTTSQ